MRVLAFAFTRSSFGHVRRMAAAAEALTARGHEVVIASHGVGRDAAVRSGAEWHEIREIAPDLRWRDVTSPDAFRAFVRARQASRSYVEESLDDELAAIDTIRPDVVIADMRNTAGVAAAMRGIPAITCHNIRLFAHPLHMVLPELLNTLGELGIDGAMRRVLGDVLAIPSIGSLDPWDELPVDVAAMVTGLVREVRHVGPMFMRAEREALLGPRLPRRKRVVVTLGGSGAGADDIRHFLDATAELAIETSVVVGPTAPAWSAEALGRWPNTQFTDFTDGVIGQLLDASLVVTHGGHGSLLETIAAGAPALFYAHAPEQAGNARRAAELRLGALADVSMSLEQVRRLADSLLEPGSLPTGIAETLCRIDGTHRLAELAEELVLESPKIRSCHAS